MRQVVKAALVAVLIIAPAREAWSATITVHATNAVGRVFVDVVGQINDEDFKTFKEQTDQIYPIGSGHLNKQMIVTLMSYGGSIGPALQIADQIRKRGMSTFVPGDRTCASACAYIWLAGRPRTVGDGPRIGFHAVYDRTTRQETGAGDPQRSDERRMVDPRCGKRIGGYLGAASAAESNSYSAKTQAAAAPTTASPGH
jgi:hypothetical protein